MQVNDFDKDYKNDARSHGLISRVHPGGDFQRLAICQVQWLGRNNNNSKHHMFARPQQTGLKNNVSKLIYTKSQKSVT